MLLYLFFILLCFIIEIVDPDDHIRLLIAINYKGGKTHMAKNLIQALIGMVIGLALLPVVGSFATELTGTGGTFEDTTVGALIDLVPVLYVIIVVASAVGFIAFNRKA
jgi:hypothetical protein